MKKYSILLLVVVFAVTMFTGCGCRNSKPAETSMPTTPATTPATQATQPTTDESMPGSDATIEDGNGPLPTNATAGSDGDTSAESSESTEASRSRGGNIPGSNTTPSNRTDGSSHRTMPRN